MRVKTWCKLDCKFDFGAVCFSSPVTSDGGFLFVSPHNGSSIVVADLIPTKFLYSAVLFLFCFWFTHISFLASGQKPWLQVSSFFPPVLGSYLQFYRA